MASTQARIGQQALAVLDVALRVPCIFIIDAIFNSYYDPGPGWAGAMGNVLVRAMGKCFNILQSGTGAVSRPVNTLCELTAKLP